MSAQLIVVTHQGSLSLHIRYACRLERIDHLAKKFNHKSDIHEEWTRGKEEMLQSQDFRNCKLNDLKVMSHLTTRKDRAGYCGLPFAVWKFVLLSIRRCEESAQL